MRQARGRTPSPYFDFLGLATFLASLAPGLLTVETAGWVLGTTITASLFFAGMIVAAALKADASVSGSVLSGSLAFGMGLGTLFGWLPIWFFFGVFVLALISVMGLMSGRDR